MNRTMLLGTERVLLNKTADLLRAAGGQAVVVTDTKRAETEFSRFRPGMVVISLDDPEAFGWQFMVRYGLNGGTKAIATTANGDNSQESTVLRLGAADYIHLPVSPEVLFARIASRAGSNGKPDGPVMDETLEIMGNRGALIMDKSRFQSFWRGSELTLTKTEFELLTALARRHGHVKSRDQLIDAIYDHGQQVAVNDRNVDSHVKRVRNKFRKVDPFFDGVETVYGIGYKLNIDRMYQAKPKSLPYERPRSSGTPSRSGSLGLVTLSNRSLQAAGM